MLKKCLLFSCILLISSQLAAKDEISRLRRENQQLRERIIQLEQRLSGIRQWLGSATLNREEVSHSSRENRLLFSLKEFSRRGNNLAMEALNTADAFRKFLADAQIGPARKAQILLQLEELEKHARIFSALSIPGTDTAGNCRVLALNHELQAVVVSAGTGTGVMPGMILHRTGNPELKLRVIATRFDGALAEVVTGSIADFPPGTPLSALIIKK